MRPEDVHLPEVLFEFRQIGKALRITAIDPQSGIEVVMVGNPKYSQTALKRLAARKLKYVIAKRWSEKPR